MEVEFDIATDGINSGARRVHDSTDRSILRTLYGVRPKRNAHRVAVAGVGAVRAARRGHLREAAGRLRYLISPMSAQTSAELRAPMTGMVSGSMSVPAIG